MIEIPNIRIGMGYDTHRLGPNRPLILGGVRIEHDQGLVGHSDADVLLHALTDAMLGALGRGDIGEWFPNTDPKWSGADSKIFLQSALQEVRAGDWQIVNLDATLFAEQPKLSPYKSPIQENLSELLSLSTEQINIKAKSGEGVGHIGRSEAISASVALLLMKMNHQIT